MNAVSRTKSSRPYQQGDHVCSIYETPEEQLATAVAYVADGLRRRERCLYVADDLDTFRHRLGETGVDVASAERRTALLLRTKDQAHLVGGHFDYERMLTMLNQAVEDALNAGFTGLRTCGDMTWLLDHALATHGSVVIGSVHRGNPFAGDAGTPPMPLAEKLTALCASAG